MTLRRLLMAIFCLTVVLAAGCGDRDDRPTASKERTAKFWSELQDSLKPVEDGFRDAKAASDTHLKLRELSTSAATINQPDSRLLTLMSELAHTFSDYAKLIDDHRTLSKLVFAKQANKEEQEAFHTSVLLFIALDKRFYRIQDRLETHRVEMQERYGLTLSPLKRVRQEFIQ
jgi:hypothetical protein